VSDTSVAEKRGRVAPPREEKLAVVDEVRRKLSSSSAAILTEYRGLKVSELEGLRRSLRQAGGEYKVYKNTLVRFATRDLGIDGIEPLLEGPTAIAFAETDVPAVAKALRDFSRTNPLLVVKGGVMGTSVLTARDATALAEIPSRDVLLGQLAGLMAAPMRQLAGLLQALPRNLAYGLQALQEQRAAGAPAGGASDSGPAPDSADSGAAGEAATAAEASDTDSVDVGAAGDAAAGDAAGADAASDSTLDSTPETISSPDPTTEGAD
jgi:large subunit ribosomal protein L10